MVELSLNKYATKYQWGCITSMEWVRLPNACNMDLGAKRLNGRSAQLRHEESGTYEG
jgi:hypothetical protein